MEIIFCVIMACETKKSSLDSSNNSLFFERPPILYVDEDYSVRPPNYGTIAKLMESLKVNGPLVAVGGMGPKAYTEAPFKLKDKVCNKEVYGWKPRTFKDHTASVPVILIGAQQTESNAYVYYVEAEDATNDKDSLIRGYKPAASSLIYVMSYDNFLKRALINLHPICPHAEWLFSVDANSILDKGEVEKKCRRIGQQIFDHYKTQARADSEAGREAVIRICNASKVLAKDGAVRKSHIERAWDGIGDVNWKWKC